MSLKDKIEDIFPLTQLQKGLLFHSLYDPEAAVYFEQLNCHLEGHVSVDAVNQAWQTLVNRHPILRTAIITKGQTEPVQVVFRNIVFKVVEEDWRGLNASAQEQRLEQFLEEDRHKGFVLNRPPLMRVTLIRLSEQSWQLVWSHHHLLLDGWSLAPLMREFFLLHKATCENVEISLPPVRPYSDFLAWLQQKNPDEGEAFWRQYMRGFDSHTPLLMMPAKKQSSKGKSVEIRFSLNREETGLLSQLARDCSVTVNTIIQGGWAILLNRYSRSEDIVYGITVAGRPPELPGVEGMIGLFINTLPLRVVVSGEQKLDAWLKLLQHQQVQMRQFEHSNLLDIQRWSDLPLRQTLFESILAFENFPVDKSLKAADFGLFVTKASFYETTHYPLSLVVVPEEKLLFKLTYDTERFDGAGMELLLKHLCQLLINMAHNPKALLSSLSLLSPSDITPDNYSVNSYSKETLAAGFADTVSQYGDRIALTYGKESLTYKELDIRANKIAYFLQKQGISPDKRVVICLERSPELIIAMLGVVKAGGVYVPIDPAYPRERIEFTIADCEAQLILTTTSLYSLFPQSVPVVCLDAEDTPYLTESTEPVIVNTLKPDNGAYVIYTSGSTGKPKGVLVTQHNVTRLFKSTNHWFGFNENDVWTLFHSFAFDFSVWEIWGTLLYGGRLVIVPYGISRDPNSFLQLIRDEKVTVLNQTPLAFTQLLVAEDVSPSTEPTTLRYIIFGGEALNLQSLRPWFESHSEEATRLVNMYGITETTVHVTYRPISPKDLENASGSVIGQPIPDLRLYLLDPYGNQLPPGVTGEIYVGGAGVARGYLNRPEQNAERFVRDRFSQNDSEKLYRSGDLGRFLPNGDLEYLGRLDHQVKIRGFRIEIGEIQAAISRFPSVQENIVVIHSNEDNEKQLIAYIVCVLGTQPSIETLRKHLQQYLPDYMVPSQFVYLDQFPLTPNGKIDRKALPIPEISRDSLEVAFVPPTTVEEKILAQIWQKVLGVHQVGRFDNYFVLGGDSIRSIRVCSLAEEAGLKIKLEQIFYHPVLSDLAASICAEKEQTTSHTIVQEPFALLSPKDREQIQDWAIDAYPLAQLQAGMLFESDYSEGVTAYNDIFSFRVRMPFELQIWEKAYAQMFERHRVLQTAFYVGEFSQPLQVILKEAPAAKIIFEDLNSLPELEQEAYLQSFIQKERANRFKWSNAPLIRFYLHRLDQNLVQASFAVHHAILDGWSLSLFIAELTSLYFHLLDHKVPLLPPSPTLQYSRFIALEQEALANENQREFWKRQLEGIPFTQLPRQPSAVKQKVPGRIAKIDTVLPESVTQGLRKLSNQLGVPLKTVLLAIHMRLLAFCSGEEEVVTGLVCNGRPAEPDGDRILGLFLNTVPFRLQLPHGSWIDLIQETFHAEQTVMPNRRFPFAQIQRMHGHQPLYESSFNFVHFHVYQGLLEMRDVELIQAQSFDETNIPLSVSWSEEVSSASLLFNITYNSNEFDENQAAAIAHYYTKMCAAAATNPQTHYAEAEIISQEEKTLIFQHRQNTVSPLTATERVHEIFERQAAQHPESAAVTCEGETWTNSELNQKANQLARFLRNQGIGSDKPVGICLERSLDMVCAILAVLKAGGCYVPLDPHYPAARLHSMVEDAKTTLILTHSDSGVKLLDNSNTQVVFLDQLAEEIAAQSCDNLEIPVLEANIAYIIFTSGSTGRAKGIAISHQALAHHMAWFLDTFAVNSSDVVLQKTPFSFDASVWEFWAALMTGAKLIMAQMGGHQDSAYITKTIQKEKVTLLQVVPTLLEILLTEPGFCECSSLRLVFSGGEALKKRVWDEFNKMAIPLVNLYGPAETTINVAFHCCQNNENTDTIPIGKPVPNTHLYILDRNFQPVPIGTPGELYIGGSQLARCYWYASRLTADRFVPNPFSLEPGDRIYRTGDSVRLLPDGNIEFLGRIDQQIKIRGFRIETSEIVTVLENQSCVVRAVIKAFSTADRPDRLVAYVEMKDPPEFWQELLRFSIRNTLPDYMVPSLFVSLDSFPLLPNGKININALREPQEEDIAVRSSYVAPRNETEIILTKIWQEVLRISHVGIEHEFFELGGDSILCLQIIAKAHAHGLQFTPADLFKHSSVSKLAPYVKVSDVKGVVPLISEGEIPLTPIQQWFFERSLAHPEHWNQAILLDLKQEIDCESLKTALEQIAESHEAFRLRFHKTTDGWKQYLVHDAHTIGFDVVDLTTVHPDELSQHIPAIASQFHTQLDLEHGPLGRAVYFQTGENAKDKLLLIIHHLIVDGVSWRIILQDLAISCSAIQTGQSVPLSTSSAGVAQWAIELHRQIETSQWDKDLAFWKTQQVSNPALPLDFPQGLAGNKENSAAQIECNFSKSETDTLLYELPRTRKARIQEVLLTVLLEVITDWTGESEIAIALESHGRDTTFTNFDVFDSVGWFTSLFPFKLEKTTDDLLSNLKSVKEQFQKLPHNGFSYGILSRKQEFANSLPQIPSGIIFNYLGQFDDNFPETAPFVLSSENSGVSHNPENKRCFQLEIIGLIVNGKLQIRFVYSQALHQESTIRHLADSFYSRFTTLLAESRTKGDSWTPADFPLASLDTEQLAVALARTSDVEDIYPLAPVQEGMLFHANYESQSGVYLQQVTGEITGVLDTLVFQKAWDYCIERHSNLRASFIVGDLPRPLQRIHYHINLPFVYHDWSVLSTAEVVSKWQELLTTDRKLGFSLETPPLMRLTLVKIEEQKWQFLWTHHHLLLDGWSLPLIFRDVIAFYQAQKQGLELNRQQPPAYRDFIHWLNAQESAAAQAFWHRELKGLCEATSLGLSFAKPSQTVAISDYQVLHSTLSQEIYTRLVAFAQKNQVTVNTLVQAAWSLLLSLYSGSEEIVFGVTVSGRPPELLDSQEIVGLFINTLPLRVKLNMTSTLTSWLQKLRDRTLEINQYSYSRLVDIQGWSDVPRGQPLFESIVVYENYPVEESLRRNSGELSVSSVQSLERTHYPVTLYALPGENLILKLAFQENVGCNEERQQLLQQLLQILERFANDEPEFIGDIGLLSKTEERDFGQQTFFERKYLQSKATVQQIFSQQASLTPNALAVRWRANYLTYEELERRSNQVAHALRQLGIEQGTLVGVGVCLERHAGLLVALLGIFKAGAAFVPLDPAFPQERLDFMLADSSAKVIIAENTTLTHVTKASAQVLLINEEGLIASSQPDTALPAIPHNQCLAYVIYTSGSTGKPKGVQIPHNALVNFLLSFREEPGLSASDILVAVTTLSFDISILELFLPLITGAQLVIADRETVRDGFQLTQLLNQSQATVMQATPATWRLLLAAGWKPNSSFCALCGGEAMPIDLAVSLLDTGVELWNVYGPTETTIWSTVNPVRKPEDALSIGQGIANTSIYILDSAGHQVPQGIVGKLFIGGAGLAYGYRGKANLTAERFIPNPFSQEPGERLYDTGDLARFLSNGKIEFLGRADFQVKIRGFRIELGDIETVLENHPAIAQAVVQAIEDTSKDKKLVAYLVTKDTETPTIKTLRSYVLEKLPDYMVPSAWVFLDTMPLTPNNKVDRRALKAPSQFHTQADYIAPRNTIEEALAEIWQELIEVERVGVKDNFFELGGHSLIAAQIHARMRKVFSIDVSLRELFDSLTIEKTAQLLVKREMQLGRTEKIAQAFLRMKHMTPEEKSRFLQEKRKTT